MTRVQRTSVPSLAGLRGELAPVALVVAAAAAFIATAALTSSLVPATLALGGLVAVAACVHRPGIGVLVLVVVLPLNDVVAQLLGHSTVLALAVGALKDVLLMALVVALLAGHREKGVWLPPSLSSFLVLTLAIGAVAGIATGDVLQALYGWRNDFEPLVLLAVLPLLLTQASARRVLTAIVAAGEVAAAIAIVTHAIGLSWLLGLDLGQPAGAPPLPASYFSAGSITPRAFSPYVGPNELGLACVLLVAVILFRKDWSRSRRTWLAVLPLVALLMTASRSAWLGLGVLVVFEVVRQLRSKRLMPVRLAAVALSVSALAGATALLISSGDPSIGGHETSLLQSLNLLLAHPLGLGTGTVGPRATRFATSAAVHTESFLLLIALEAGVLALFSYAGVMIAAGFTIMRARVAPHADADLLMLGVAVMLASLPGQLALPTLQDGAVSWLLWSIVGVSLFHALHARYGPVPDRDSSPAHVPRRTPVEVGR